MDNMYKYDVTVDAFINVVVEAENEELAIEKAYDEIEKIPTSQFDFEVQDITCLDKDKYSYKDFRDY